MNSRFHRDSTFSLEDIFDSVRDDYAKPESPDESLLGGYRAYFYDVWRFVDDGLKIGFPAWYNRVQSNARARLEPPVCSREFSESRFKLVRS